MASLLDPVFQLGGSALLDVFGIGNAQAASNDALPNPPLWVHYYVKNGQIYDKANVAVSADSVRNHILRNEKAISGNMRAAGAAPKLVEFANKDLSAQNENMRKLLEQFPSK